MTFGGTIKNLTIDQGFRAIWIYIPTEDIILDNVTVCGNVGYAINTGEHAKLEGIDLIVTDSTFGGWTSFAGIASASFTNCKFIEGGYGYAWPSNTLVKPYIATTFTNCDFIDGYYLDLSSLDAKSIVKFYDCTVGGDSTLTALSGWQTTDETDYPADGCLYVELPKGRFLSNCVFVGLEKVYDVIVDSVDAYWAAIDEGKHVYYNAK